MVYDEIHGYALTATNPFFDESSPKDHVFVDEFSCIGTFYQYTPFSLGFLIFSQSVFKVNDGVSLLPFHCIGCKNCANVCSDVFAIEEDFGRARAYNQSGLRDSVEQAVESW